MLKPDAALKLFESDKNGQIQDESANAIMNETLNQSKVEANKDNKSTENELDSSLINVKLSENAIEKKPASHHDRRKTFIIKDDAKQLHSSYSATKKFKFKSSFHFSSSNSPKKLKMKAFAVSEYGNKKVNNVVRTLFCHHDSRRLKLIDS